MKNLKSAFTLIELLIVISIIGILAAALLIGLNPVEQINKARDGGKVAQAKEVINACERYYVSRDVWTSTGATGCGELITAKELKTGACGNIVDMAVNPCTATISVKSDAYITACGCTDACNCVIPDDITGTLL